MKPEICELIWKVQMVQIYKIGVGISNPKYSSRVQYRMQLGTPNDTFQIVPNASEM